MADEEAFLAGIPRFLRRLEDERRVKSASENKALAPGLPARPRSIAALAAQGQPPAPKAPDPHVSAPARDVASQQEAVQSALREGQLTASVGQASAPDLGPDYAFQVMLPQDVVRQVRLRAAREGTTNRAVVLTALARDGIAIPDGSATDRRRKRA